MAVGVFEGGLCRLYFYTKAVKVRVEAAVLGTCELPRYVELFQAPAHDVRVLALVLLDAKQHADWWAQPPLVVVLGEEPPPTPRTPALEVQAALPQRTSAEGYVDPGLYAYLCEVLWNLECAAELGNEGGTPGRTTHHWRHALQKLLDLLLYGLEDLGRLLGFDAAPLRELAARNK